MAVEAVVTEGDDDVGAELVDDVADLLDEGLLVEVGQGAVQVVEQTDLLHAEAPAGVP